LAPRRAPSGPSITELMSIARMVICSFPESINPRTDRFQNQMVVTGDSFPGVRLLSAESAWVIGSQRYLGCAIRPQGFSPSRRLSPTQASWLCFAPHPPIGFWSSERSPLRQPRYLSISVALLSFRQPSGSTGEPVSPSAPAFHRPPRPSRMRYSPELPPRTSVARRTSSSSVPTCVVAGEGERPVRSRGLTRGICPARASPSAGKLQRRPAGQGVDFRALIRRRVRFWQGVLPPYQADALLTFPPSEVYQLDRWAFALPSSAFDASLIAFRRRPPSSGGPGYRSDRAWKKLRRVSSTPCGFLTSLPDRAASALGDEPRPSTPGCAFASPERTASGGAALSAVYREADVPATMKHGGSSPLAHRACPRAEARRPPPMSTGG